MSFRDKKKYVLLSNLIKKLNENDYYRVFAKTIAMTENSGYSLPDDGDLIKEMFYYFIKNNLLDIYYNESIASLDIVREEAKYRVSEDMNKDIEWEYDHILENDVYINVKDLKQLYANKCIVLPNSLLADI